MALPSNELNKKVKIKYVFFFSVKETEVLEVLLWLIEKSIMDSVNQNGKHLM